MIGIIVAGPPNESMKQQAATACHNLLNDTVRKVTIVWLKDTLSLSAAYYAPRNRYRAIQLLDQEKNIYRKYRDSLDALIVITGLPISATVHGVHDYGICGLAYLGGRVSIISHYHLSEEVFKQNVRHEWGHGAAGIPHCEEQGCIMNDAKGKMINTAGNNKFKPGCYKRAYAELFGD